MNILLGLIAIAFGIVLIKFREACADAIGEPSWAQSLGGMQIILVIVGVLMCLWGLATMTGTMDVLLSPMLSLFPGYGVTTNGGF